MNTLQIENLPHELYSHIQTLAVENNFTLNEAVIHLLKQAFQSNELKMLQSKPTSEILQKIRARPRVNPTNFGLPNSTVLIREDRTR
jgi:hypothetical protein